MKRHKRYQPFPLQRSFRIEAPAEAAPSGGGGGDPEPEPENLLSAAGDKALERIEKGGEPENPEAPAPEPKADDPEGGDKALDPGEVEARKRLNKLLAEGQFLPKERFDQVTMKLRAYESFGTPEEIRQKLAAPAKPEPKAEETLPDDPLASLSAEDKAAREELLRLFPEMKKVGMTDKQVAELKKEIEERKTKDQKAEEARYAKLAATGTQKLKEWATAAGLKIDSPRKLDALIRSVTGSYLEADKQAADSFYSDGNIDALKKAFDEFYKDNYGDVRRDSAAELHRDKTKQDKLPKPPVRGGVPVTEPPEKAPKDFREAGDRAAERVFAR